MPNARITKGLLTGFLRSVERFPERPALEVEGRALSYEELFAAGADIADTLQQSPAGPAGSVYWPSARSRCTAGFWAP